MVVGSDVGCAIAAALGTSAAFLSLGQVIGVMHAQQSPVGTMWLTDRYGGGKRERGRLDVSERSEEVRHMQLTVFCGAAQSGTDCLMVGSSPKGLLSR